MQATTLFQSESLSVYDFRCTAGPGDRPFAEMHDRHSVSYVRSGGFGYRAQGRDFDLVAGAVLVGRPGLEYTATHEHHACGDECLSVKLSPALADSLGRANWEAGRVPPVPELMVIGELAQAAAEGRSNVSVDEAGMMLAGKFAALTAERNGSVGEASPRERRRAVETALWIEANAAGEIDLEAAARYAGLSAFHFLRIFRNALGVTPHQYLVRSRLKRAAKLLAQEDMPVTEVALDVGFADLSNFVRTFGRAAGVSPRGFRQAAKGKRKIFQERLAALA